MAKFCRRCGRSLNQQGRFCSACGTPVHSVQAGCNNAYIKPKKKTGKVFMSIFAVVMAVAVALYGWPGFLRNKNALTAKKSDTQNLSDKGIGGAVAAEDIRLTEKDYKVEPIVVELEAGSTTARAGSVRVDFGELNILEDTRLEVRDLGVRKDASGGESAQIYDLTVGGDGEFPGVVSVTVPCSDAGSRAKYLNPDTGAWEPVYSKIDEASGTMTLYTTHFSTFGIFSGFEHTAGFNSGPLSEVRFNQDVLDKLLEACEANNKTFFKVMAGSDVGQKILLDALGDGLKDSGLVTAAGETTANIAEEVFKFVGNSGKAQLAKSLGKKLSYIGAGLTALKVASDWYESGSFTEAFKKNRGAILEATVGVAAASLGSATLGVVGAIIWAVNTVDAEVESLKNGGYENAWEHAYYKFTFEYGAFSPSTDKFCVYLPNRMYSRAILENEQPEMAMADAVKADETNLWGKFIKEEFLKNRHDPAKIFQGIDDRIDKYMETFWQLTPKVRKAIAEEIHKADAWKEPSKSERKKLKLAAKAKMHLKLRRYYGLIYERLLLDAKTKLLWEIEDLEKTMNTVTSISVVEIDENGKEKPLSAGDYKNYAAAIVTSPDAKPGTWSWKPGSKKKPNFECTLYNYLAAGSPKYVNFYESWDDLTENKVAFSKEFAFDQGEIKIIISDSSLSIEDIAGTYNVQVSDIVWGSGDQKGKRATELLEQQQEAQRTFEVSDGKLYLIFDDLNLELSFDPKTGKAYGEYEYLTKFNQKMRETYEFIFSKKGNGVVFEATRTSYRSVTVISSLKGEKQ